jgi:hypothetical protein
MAERGTQADPPIPTGRPAGQRRRRDPSAVAAPRVENPPAATGATWIQSSPISSTTHFFGVGRTDLVLDVVNKFLEAPMPED